jgi:hypothetical protein
MNKAQKENNSSINIRWTAVRQIIGHSRRPAHRRCPPAQHQKKVRGTSCKICILQPPNPQKVRRQT